MIGKASTVSVARTRLFDGLFSSHDDKGRRLYREVGQFLSDHRLEPCPANYAVAHAFVTRSDPAVVRAVNDATFGDMRLSQSAADAILVQLCGRNAAVQQADASVAALASSIDDARERFERYAGIVDVSRADAQAYGDALASEAATLSPAAAAAQEEAVTALLALTHSMIDKTRSAESQLRAASLEMEDLRVSLAEARADAGTDALTGLPNRRAFEASFAHFMGVDPAQPIALALCDIDLFKAINDRHGHDVGDRVIRLVARELAEGCKDASVARYGGEEFAALFVGHDVAEAAMALDATRAAIAGRSFKVTGTGAALDGLSFSGGVVAVRPGEPVRDAVRRADTALYRAKQGGRNRIELG